MIEMTKTAPVETLDITEKLVNLLKAEPPTELKEIKKQNKEMKRHMKKHHRRHDFSERLDLMYAIIELQPDRETVGLFCRNVSFFITVQIAGKESHQSPL